MDIGGTNIRCALYPETGIIPLNQIKTSTCKNGQPTIDRIISVIDDIWPDPDNSVVGICAAVPGSIDVKEGMIFLAPNIPDLKDVGLKKILEKRYHVPVYVNNDARLAAVGEWKHGAGIGHDNLLYFTISTDWGTELLFREGFLRALLALLRNPGI